MKKFLKVLVFSVITMTSVSQITMTNVSAGEKNILPTNIYNIASGIAYDDSYVTAQPGDNFVAEYLAYPEYNDNRKFKISYNSLKDAYTIESIGKSNNFLTNSVLPWVGNMVTASPKSGVDGKVGENQYWKLNPVNQGYEIVSYINSNHKMKSEEGFLNIVISTTGESNASTIFNINIENQRFVDGVYRVNSSKTPVRSITKNPTNSNLEFSGMENQVENFKIKFDKNKGAYKLESTSTPNNLLSWTSSAGNNVILFSDNSYADQYWNFIYDGANDYMIRSEYNKSKNLERTDSNNLVVENGSINKIDQKFNLSFIKDLKDQ